MFQSLQARLIFLFVAFVLLVVVSVGAMIWGSETQRQDALVINLAGRQRMLAQQMTRLALEADSRKSAVDAALLEAEAVFDRTLYALREGGAAPYPPCLLYTSDAADERSSVDLGGRRIIKKKKKRKRERRQMNK